MFLKRLVGLIGCLVVPPIAVGWVFFLAYLYSRVPWLTTNSAVTEIPFAISIAGFLDFLPVSFGSSCSPRCY